MQINISFRTSYAGDKEVAKEELAAFISNCDASSPRQNIYINPGEDVMEFGIFFIKDPLMVEFKKDGYAYFSINTHNGGPGYHAAVIEQYYLLNEITSFKIDQTSIYDETGYWQHRDFKKLQNYMCNWLTELASRLLAPQPDEDALQTVHNLPENVAPDPNGHFACHSMGYIEKHFFEELLLTSDKEPYCRSFFIWWDHELDAQFHLKCAVFLIWSNINWLPPEQDFEFADYHNAARCLEIAWQISRQTGEHLPFPVAEWLEIARIVGDEDLVRELRQRFTIDMHQPPLRGYKRGHLTYQADDGWSLRLPGRLHLGMTSDGELAFWDNNRCVRIATTLSAREEHAELTPAEKLLEYATLDMKKVSVTLPFAPEAKSAIAYPSTVGLQNEYSVITLFSAINGYLLSITVTYKTEELKTWAMEIFYSLQMPKNVLSESSMLEQNKLFHSEPSLA